MTNSFANLWSEPFEPSLVNEKDACGVGFIYNQQPSHTPVFDAMEALARVEHRGALAADGKTGDGAGVMAEIPRGLLKDDGFDIADRDAVGMVFLSRAFTKESKEIFEEVVISYGFSIKGWRNVPTRSEVLGQIASKSYPSIQQVVLAPDADIDSEEAELRLYVARQKITRTIKEELNDDNFYIASLSNKSIVYKALTTSNGLRHFYIDLTDSRYQSRWALFHRRFSTNTYSQWKLAQPFRFMGHNGEINTINGNINWLKARLASKSRFSPEKEPYKVKPDWAGSDSSVLDYALEMVLMEGDSPEAALMKLIPEAYENELFLKENRENPELLHFYEYFASIQEPWDGPALIVYSDGKSIGATLDRNGLRPCRYSLFEDGTVLLCSEAGMPVSTDAPVIKQGRLGPGGMLSVDIETGAVRKNLQVKKSIASSQPYGQWLLQQRRALCEMPFSEEMGFADADLVKHQNAYGYGLEDLDVIIASMVLNQTEPILSMGDDTPIAVLSGKPKTIFEYFKQKFAQVTNPPIDPIRERVVMSLQTNIGVRAKNLMPDSVSAQTMLLPSPVINEEELRFVFSLEEPLKATKISTVYDREQGLETAIDALCKKVREEVKFGCSIVVLSDRQPDLRSLAIPPMMAAGAVHNDLTVNGLRLNTSIVIDSAQCWTSHHLASLLAVGAQAVCPYLAFESVRHWYFSDKGKTKLARERTAGSEELSLQDALNNYKAALEHGLLKILSKMGISKVSSYIGAKILECLGLDRELVAKCFPGINSPIGGMTFAEIEAENFQLFERATLQSQVEDQGVLRRKPNGEFHRFNPELVKALHQALDLKKENAQVADRKKQFEIYSALLEAQPASSLRDLLKVKSDRSPLKLSEVESVESILSRFLTGGMSLGALSKESHESLAIAMNRIGARSNSGEGGEDSLRYYPIKVKEDGTSDDFPGLTGLKEGDSAASKIRQVASGRFGVTPEYLATAEQLEIKIAQGAKPGEGGQLPGHKISPYIASLRRTKPGVPLISPPPHHDIYSIEDLSQLIWDLKAVNPTAEVSVKLVAEHGIGTISTGVAKANADIIHVSGHDGGTGASPVSSIKHAGMPWELGLHETHSTLVERGLRNRVQLRVDGGLKSGMDVIKASILGANQFAFGTIALLSQGCIMARVCHTNNCPVGIATQKENLRKRFSGDPNSVVEFFTHLAEEVRFLLAELGYPSLSELTGRMDLFSVDSKIAVTKTENLDLIGWLKLNEESSEPLFCGILEPEERIQSLNEVLVKDIDVKDAIENEKKLVKEFKIQNTDRSVGATMSGFIAKRYGEKNFDGELRLKFVGVAGQSFGAFNSDNVHLELTGQANDYVGKGMNGGSIVVKNNCHYKAVVDHTNPGDQNVLIGNTALYGATGGKLFVEGQVGERFAVRNSNASAVIEGAGDHLCEYMTGGRVVVLGPVGRNFGAGMTGGLAYIYDPEGNFRARFNGESDKVLKELTDEGDFELQGLIKEFFQLTDSGFARQVLADWKKFREQFVQVVPESELDNIAVVSNRSCAIYSDVVEAELGQSIEAPSTGLIS